ncbi:hypothetical protein ACLOJK_027462 [Asimina triloba]
MKEKLRRRSHRRPSIEVSHSEVIPFEGLKANSVRTKDVLVRGLESSEARVEEVGSLSDGQSVRERRGLAPSVRVDLGCTSSAHDNKEVFWRPIDIEARALKILGDLLSTESRAIRECFSGLRARVR